jgi:hypothetical protein
VAQKIFAQRRFEAQITYFSSTRALAEYFAIRSYGKRNTKHSPAVIRITLYESDLKQWRQNRLVDSSGFSEGDRPELHGKTQLIFNAEAIRFLNRDMFHNDMQIEPINHNG